MQNIDAVSELLAYKTALNESVILSVTDIKGQILSVNKKFCEISQYEEHELIGKNHNIVNSDYHPKKFFKDLWKTILSGKIWRGDIKNKSKYGTYYWVDTTIVPVLNEKGTIISFLSLRSVVTSRKESEQSLIRSNIQSQALLNSLEKSYEELRLMEKLNSASVYGASILEISEIALEVFSKITKCEINHLYFVDSEEKLYIISKNISDQYKHNIEEKLNTDLDNLMPRPLPGSFFKEALNNGKIIILTDKKDINRVIKEHSLDKEMKTSAVWIRENLRMKSFFIIPLKEKSKVFALITLSCSEILSEEEISKIKRFKKHIATVLSKAKAESQIIEQKKFIETVINYLPADITVYDAQQNPIFKNDSFIIKNKPLSKYTEIEKNRQNIYLGLEQLKLSEVLKTRESTNWVEEYVAQMNSKITILRQLNPYYEHGELKYIFSYGLDITSLKNAELMKDEYIRQLEKMTTVTSHNIRLPVSNLMGILNLLENDELTQDELLQILKFMKQSLYNLDDYTRKLVKRMDAYRKKLDILDERHNTETVLISADN